MYQTDTAVAPNADTTPLPPHERLSALVSRTAFDAALRTRMLADPSTVLREHGIDTPDGATIRCMERTADVMLVLPAVVSEPLELSTEDLLGINGGEGSPTASASVSAVTTSPASFIASMAASLIVTIVSLIVTQTMNDH
ncbi:MAG: nitrile hydratase subunit alpha [Gemmatimonadaceae bacterium]|jgi:hypothetical protein|nr:nitrile hydratase subunit alpha [Gemmatimonadaceae bacterium]